MKNKDKKLIHDLKNKLFVIEHHYKKLKSDPDGKSEGAIQASLDRCFELINHYVADEGDSSQHDVFTLEEIISNSSMPHYEELEKMYNLNIEVAYDIEGGDKKVRGNNAEFKKVRENIVENAANAKASSLKVTIKGREDRLDLIYENDGLPISDAFLEQINSYSYGEELEEFKSIGTKIIKEVCAEHGFTVNYKKTDFGTKVVITVPYV